VTERDEERLIKVEARIRESLNPPAVSQRSFPYGVCPETKLTEMTLPEEKVLEKVERRIHLEETGEHGKFPSKTVAISHALSGAS